MLVVQFDPEHGSRQDGLHASFDFNMFFFKSPSDTGLWLKARLRQTRKSEAARKKNRGPEAGPRRQRNSGISNGRERAAATATSAIFATLAAAAGALFAGRATLTVRARPSMDLPFIAATAFWASSSELMVTKPKPRGRPVCGPHQIGFDHGAVGGKGVLQVIFGGVEGKISDKQFIAHVMF